MRQLRFIVSAFRKDKQLVSGRQSQDLNPGLILCKAHVGERIRSVGVVVVSVQSCEECEELRGLDILHQRVKPREVRR